MKYSAKHVVITILCLLIVAASGCRVIQTAADAPGQAVRAVTPGTSKPSIADDPVEIQAILIRFADAFIARMIVGVDALQLDAKPLPRADLLRWKLAFGSSTCAIASGANAQANLLDMTAYVMETRMALESNWMPRVFGDSAVPLLESCRASEAEIWRVSEKILSRGQQRDLRAAVELWHSQNPATNNLPKVRAVGLATEVVKAQRHEGARGGTLLGLLMIDPLAELDPARRELAETRLFAERLLFVGRHLPTLLRWQTELLSLNTLTQPAVQAWTTNVTHIAEAVTSLSITAEKLPQQVAEERKALLEALKSQEKALRPLIAEAQQTLLAGSGLATNLTTTLHAFDGVLKRLKVGQQADRAEHEKDANDQSDSSFRIQDYGEVAERLEAAAVELNALLQTFDETLGANSRGKLAQQIDPVVQRTRLEGEALLDHLFKRAILLIVAVLLAALIYRFATTKRAQRKA